MIGALASVSWSLSAWPSWRRLGKLARIDAVQGDAGRLANSGVVVLQGGLERRDGFFGLFAEVAQPDRGAPADIGALFAAEGFDQRRDNFSGIVFSPLQETNRYDPVSFMGRTEIRDQLIGRFLTAAGARQQAEK
jgi:hypothetical protein